MPSQGLGYEQAQQEFAQSISSQCHIDIETAEIVPETERCHDKSDLGWEEPVSEGEDNCISLHRQASRELAQPQNFVIVEAESSVPAVFQASALAVYEDRDMHPNDSPGQTSIELKLLAAIKSPLVSASLLLLYKIKGYQPIIESFCCTLQPVWNLDLCSRRFWSFHGISKRMQAL